MGVVDFAEYLNSAIQAGSAVEGTAVKVLADNGTEIGEAVYQVIEGGNGVASEVAIATQTGGAGAIATGVAYLALGVEVAAAAVAAALGVEVGYAIGTGLYNMDPQFWGDLSDELFNSGKTLGGKIVAYWNGNNLHLDEETIEIFKNLMIQYNVFDYGDKATNEHYGEPESSEYFYYNIYTEPILFSNYAAMLLKSYDDTIKIEISGGKCMVFPENPQMNRGGVVVSINNEPYNCVVKETRIDRFGNETISYPTLTMYEFDVKNTEEKVYYYFDALTGINLQNLGFINANYTTDGIIGKTPQVFSDLYHFIFGGDVETGSDIPLQPGATYPDDTPFPQTYPDWYPLEYPQTLPDPSDLPDLYPLKYPGIGDDPYPEQDPAQNPDPESVPETYPVIIPDFDLPDPDPNQHEDPEPEPDPDPQPDPEPLPDDEPIEPGDDPVDPNGDPDPSIPIVVPPLPATVNSSRLFTVYNPTSSQLDALGGYLWDSSIIAAIRDIWQEPMDGLISLQQVFVTPSTSGNHNIILGFLDSGVSAAVVSNQFVTVDCGSVQVNEDKKNATDYAPYTSLHLYLPFIGIVELDTNECMNATISVKYKVDVYTGTCLAQVSVDRDIDMPNDPILYTFSGNCSQQLPLTSGNATGLLTALIGAVTAGFSAASGGGLSTLAGAQLLGNSLTHEMFHVSHSGNISANAGIMGQKKPYLIIGRRHGYDANNYNAFYGYPANKTINIGNHTGFIRVKKCWLKTNALQEEYEEIMKLLEEGVFV